MSAYPCELQQARMFLKYCKSLSGVLLGLSTFLPSAGFAAPGLVPPWPQGAHYLGSAVSALFVLFVFLSQRNSDAATFPARIARCFWLGIGALALYLFLLANYVKQIDVDVYVVTGFTLSDEAAEAVNDERVTNTARDLLAYYGYASADRVWAFRSIVKWLVCVSFISVFAILAGTFTLVVLRNMIEDRDRDDL